MKYYKAGYYLIKKKPINFGADRGNLVETCSACINLSVFDNWCLSWMSEKLDKKEKIELELTDSKIKKIHKWTDIRFDNGSNVFPDLKTAIEFKDLFLKDKSDVNIYSLVFPEVDTELLISEFAEGKNTTEFNYNNGNFGLRKNLIKKEEDLDNYNEKFLGYDFIGVECDGSFHSFYCHDITKKLIDKFSLTLNSNGLFEKIELAEKIREYLNDPDTGLEPVPWYIVKVKMIEM
jgi:hypothetical protein